MSSGWSPATHVPYAMNLCQPRCYYEATRNPAIFSVRTTQVSMLPVSTSNTNVWLPNS